MRSRVTLKHARRIRNEIKKLAKDYVPRKTVTVGMHEGGEDRKGISNAGLGAVQHFGSEKISVPARPFLDVGVESASDKYSEIVAAAMKSKQNIDDTLEQIGVIAVAAVQEYMTDLKEPANAESTIKKKSSSNPLIDTGELRQAVTYNVTTEDIIKEGI